MQPEAAGPRMSSGRPLDFSSSPTDRAKKAPIDSAAIEKRTRQKVQAYCLKVGLAGAAGTVAMAALGMGLWTILPFFGAGTYLVGSAEKITAAARAEARRELAGA